MLFIYVVLFVFFICSCISQYRYNVAKQELKRSLDILGDIKSGNIQRRLLYKNGNLTEELFIRINEIIVQYNSDMNRLKKIEQANRQLMTSLAHDLKTPATTLVGYLEAVSADIVVGEEKQEYIEIARDKSVLLNEYMDMLFEWFQLYSKERVFQICENDIVESTRNAIINMVPELEKNGFNYEINIPDEEIIVPFDLRSYTRIINNIVQNAIRHSGGNRVSIGLEDHDSNLMIIIRDNGKGIPENEQVRIFERLYKCDHSRSTVGTGLGLSIVSEIMNAHGGKVEVNSQADHFTEFRLLFPKLNKLK